MKTNSETDARGQPIDLDEVADLVAALHRDLARVKTGSSDLQALRDETDALRRALDSSPPDAGRVQQGLKTLHGMFDSAVEVVVDDAIIGAQYVARIGRMLGL